MKNELKKNKNWCQIVPSIPWLENSPLLFLLLERKKTLMTEQEKLKAQTLMELLLLWGKITIKKHPNLDLGPNPALRKAEGFTDNLSCKNFFYFTSPGG